MRSSSLGWLLNLVGYDVFLLNGGYKSYRQFVLKSFETNAKIIILSGATGSGKTDILSHLSHMGEQVVNLEGLANHKGSAFGGFGEPPPPTQQNFENEIAKSWRSMDLARPVWLEDESQKIGMRIIPIALWKQMRNAPVIHLDMPIEFRVQRLLADYGRFDTSKLNDAIVRLRKRMGGQHMQAALDAVEKSDLEKCADILLRHYYDKTYHHGLSKRNSDLVYPIDTFTLDAQENAEKVLAFSKVVFEKIRGKAVNQC